MLASPLSYLLTMYYITYIEIMLNFTFTIIISGIVIFLILGMLLLGKRVLDKKS